ncbi:MAG: hypothetical protein D6730_02585 [Bacteroidetes bacterium]|nr:MAG: hypothetical protein D6730_02585 [Bacteroidota bacterium]
MQTLFIQKMKLSELIHVLDKSLDTIRQSELNKYQHKEAEETIKLLEEVSSSYFAHIRALFCRRLSQFQDHSFQNCSEDQLKLILDYEAAIKAHKLQKASMQEVQVVLSTNPKS